MEVSKVDLPKVAMAEVASVLVVDGNTYIRTMHEDTREYIEGTTLKA
jgi:hypothetical protein